MVSNDLNTWVSDKLMVLLGYSQTDLVKYLIAMAKNSKSPTELVRELVDYRFALSDETRVFAEEVYARVPRKTAGVNLYQKHEAEAALLLRKQKSFSLLEADHDEDEGNEEKRSVSESRKSDKRQKRFRKKLEQSEDDDDDDEVVIVREDERNVRRKVSEAEDDGTESEEERLQDQKEREKLEQHLRERDTARTRKLTEPGMSKKEQGHSRGKNILRKTPKQMEELKNYLKDERYLFGGEKLSEVEIREFRYKKEIYELLENTEEEDTIEEYRMPDGYDQEGGVDQEKRFAVCTQRYRTWIRGRKLTPLPSKKLWRTIRLKTQH